MPHSPPTFERGLHHLDLDPAFQQWAKGLPNLRTAWHLCPRADWLIDLAAHGRVARFLLVQAALRCASRATLRGGDTPPSEEVWRTLQMVWGWSHGAVKSARCWAAGFRLSERADKAPDAEAHALRAAASAAFACDAAADADYYASRGHAAEAARHATAAVGTCGEALADEVRATISFEALERALKQRPLEGPPPGESGRRPVARHKSLIPIPTDAGTATRKVSPRG